MSTTQSTSNPLPEPLKSFRKLTPGVQASLDEIERLRERYGEAVEQGKVLPNVVEAARIELTYHSNAIEGNTLTLRDTQLVVEGLTPGGGKSLREVYEARNHDRAVRMIEAWATTPEHDLLTQRSLLDVHGVVLADITPGAAGMFRRERVLIAGTPFIPPGSHRFPELIPALLRLAREGSVHPVIRAAELHYNLAAVHPFNDGNGRTARLMMNALLLRQGYPLSVVEVQRRREYLTALDAANVGDALPFLQLVLQIVLRALGRMLF